MKKAFVIWSDINHIGFGIVVDAPYYETAKRLSLEGFSRWNNREDYPEYEHVGYVEPAIDLMKEAGIIFDVIDVIDVNHVEVVFW